MDIPVAKSMMWGVSSTIMENHGAVIAILEIDEDKEDTGSDD